VGSSGELEGVVRLLAVIEAIEGPDPLGRRGDFQSSALAYQGSLKI
jgi:hypothetical protein